MNVLSNPALRRTTLATLLGASLLVVAIVAQARPSGPPPDRGGPPLERAIEELDLDAETLAAAYAVLDAARDEHRTLRRELSAARDSLHQLVAQDAPDRATVMSAVDALGTLETRMHKHRLGTMLDVRALLDAPERDALDEKLGPRERRHGGPAPDGASRRPRPAS